MPDPNNRKAEGYNPLCGDKITIFLYVEGDVIKDLGFQGTGCAISKASASLMTDALKGKTLEQADAMFEQFHHLVTGRCDPGGGRRARQTGRAGRRARVPDARQVRQPGVAYAESGDAGRTRCRFNRVTSRLGSSPWRTLRRRLLRSHQPTPQASLRQAPQASPLRAGSSEHAQLPGANRRSRFRKVFDPEIPVNIYELGLVYDIDVDSGGNA